MGNVIARSNIYHIDVDQSGMVTVKGRGPKGDVGPQGPFGPPNTGGGFATDADLAAAYASVDARLDVLEETDTWHNIVNDGNFVTSPGWPTGRYKKYRGQVFLAGQLTNPSAIADTRMFTLPDGYRPGKYLRYGVITNNVIGEVRIDPSGSVTFISGDPTNVPLFGINFEPL